jgi:peptidoglycan-N-acetylglucosamine deacetylase
MNRIYRAIRYRITHRIINNRTYKKVERKLIGNIIRVNTNDPAIALTFDGGPDAVWTPKVLDILTKYGVQATFFMIGKHAEKNRDIIEEVASKGHIIGNHTWDHPSLPILSNEEIKWQVRSCAKVLGDYNVNLFRPPYGHLDKRNLFQLFLLKQKVITWDVHPFDWQERDPNWMVANMLETIRPGSIVLLHDAVCVQRQRSRWHMLEALENFLSDYRKSYEFFTIPELLKHGNPEREIWNIKPGKDFFETHVQVTD